MLPLFTSIGKLNIATVANIETKIILILELISKLKILLLRSLDFNKSEIELYSLFDKYFFRFKILYLSLIKQVDCIVGNSSSGFIEAPYLKIPTVNIGSRQDGRPFSYNIVNTDNKKKSIKLLCLIIFLEGKLELRYQK